MIYRSLSLFLLAAILSLPVFAASTDYCGQIKTVCTNAGFVGTKSKPAPHKWLFTDCIIPIIQGTAAPKKSALPLPQVDASTVAACKKQNPKFGAAN